MLFYNKMRWDIKGMSFDELWDLEGEEAKAAVESIELGIVKHLYKVASEQYVIAVGSAPSVGELDRYSMGRLPMHEHLIFEEVWSLEEGFTIDVAGYLKTRRERMEREPKFLYYIQMAWDPQKRLVDGMWGHIKEALKDAEDATVLGVYRVAGAQRIIAIVDVESAEGLNTFSCLPALNSPAVEKVWALRDYTSFAEDVWKHYKFANS